MTKSELKEKIFEIAHLRGEFLLRSGKIATEYFDKYRFESSPTILQSAAEHLSQLVPLKTEILAGLELGGIPIATAISLHTGIPAVFVRKKAKEYGTKKLAEGAEFSTKNVCVIEDVVTTGGQIIESVKELRKLGANIEYVLCVVLRNKEAYKKLEKENLKLIPLFEENLS